jgi:hypothetical protein
MYNVNYNSTIENLLVPDKRTKKTVAYNNALVAGVANDHNLLFTTYKEYQILSNWTAGTYAKNVLVKYGKSVFQSTENANTSEPTLSEKWRLVSDNFLGSDFRLSIRGEKLNLEFALNTWFGTTFRQPVAGLSDIYLTTNNILPIDVFRVGIIEAESTKVYTTVSDQFVINSYSFLTQFNLAINVPIAFFNSLGATDEIRKSIIRSFANKYINAGLTYQILTY